MKNLHQRVVRSLPRAATVCAFGLALTAIPSVAGAVTTLTAVVNANGTFVRGTPAGTTSSRIGLGEYRVVFSRNVHTCTFNATVGSPNTIRPQGGNTRVYSMPGNAKGVAVETGSQGEPENRPFHLMVVCPTP